MHSRADAIVEEQKVSSTTKWVELTIPSSDIEAMAYVDNLSTLIVSPTYNDDLGKILRFDGHTPGKIQLDLAENETTSHVYAKLEYFTLIKLQYLPYFSEEGLELISVKE